MPFQPKKLSEQFEYRKPTEGEVDVMRQINDQAHQLAETIETLIPGSAETTLAIRKLQECRMWANAAIIFNPLDRDSADAS